MPGSEIAVAILTLNEERDLPRCLANIPRGTPVYVVDSGSTDGTLELAERAGCKVLHRGWTGFADQRNFAIEHLKASFDWVLFVDADEIFPERIWRWVSDCLPSIAAVDVVYFSQRMFINGSRLDYAPGYPVYHPRLVRCLPQVFAPNGTGHGESVKVGLRVRYVDLPYDHHVINNDVPDWMRKHVGLALQESRADIQPRNYVITKRARINHMFPTGMSRVIARFLYHYVIRSGWRDKSAGLNYALLYAWYEFTKYILHRLDERHRSAIIAAANQLPQRPPAD